jgi:Putative transposase/Transposase zinc-binding domain
MVDFQSIFQDKTIAGFNAFSQTVFDKLARCRTAQMGSHKLLCDNKTCGKVQYQFHNCGNRNCPNCGGLKKEEWIDNRMQELLPTPYYHLVFTLPQQLNPLILGNRKLLFKLLFDAASQTIIQHSRMEKYLGADCGITMILHTWGQDLSFHPHVHCIVTGGGFDGTKWVDAKRKRNNFLFPETSLQNQFKKLFLQQLLVLPIQRVGIDVEKMANDLQKIRWNVFAKAPFGGPGQVVNYLGRYTHKIGITKQRIVGLSQNTISFSYKDYTDGNKQKIMTLTRVEFLRRFELHILPKRFTKIRHYGFLQNHGKGARLRVIRASLGLSPAPVGIKIPVGIRMLEKYGKDIYKCPCCGTGRLELVSSRRYFVSQTQEMQTLATNLVRNKAAPAKLEQQK